MLSNYLLLFIIRHEGYDILKDEWGKFSHFPVKIGLIGGVGGIPQISFSLDS